MVSITCPRCLRVGSLKIAPPAGAKVRCPGCGERFDVAADPDESSVIIDLDDASEPDAYAPVPAGPVQPTPAFSATPAAYSPPAGGVGYPMDVPPEPWYYEWIDRLAKRVWFGCRVLLFVYAALAILIVMSVVYLSFFTNVPGDYLIRVIIFFGIVYLGLWFALLPTFLFAARLRLTVDAARNIRATRYR